MYRDYSSSNRKHGNDGGTSTGIEPYFAFEYFRQSRLGYDKQLVPIAQEWLDTHPNKTCRIIL